MKLCRMGIVMCCVLAVTLGLFVFPSTTLALEIDIDVAPNVLNIQSQGEVVSVHTNILIGQVVGGSVMLNDIEIEWWKSDNRGNFVAKFLMSEVKALYNGGDLDPVELPGEITLVLVGDTIDGEVFTGSQTITVIDVEPAGTGRK